jgi:hypothetical protein
MCHDVDFSLIQGNYDALDFRRINVDLLENFLYMAGCNSGM